MNESGQARFRDRILARLAEIVEEDRLGKDGQATVELDQQAVGRLSRMDALQNQAMAQATQARRQAEARRLKIALSRIEDGEYGYCEACGDEIATGRLELYPTATKCIHCASG